MFNLRAFLSMLVLLNVCNGFAFGEVNSNPSYHPLYQHPQISYEAMLIPLSTPKTVLNKHISLVDKKEEKLLEQKIHPRKKFLEEAPSHTQRAWLYSAVVPGLGQLYNENYWKLPLIYGIFAGLAWGAIYNHDEYTLSRREFIEKCKKAKQGSASSNLGNYMNGRKRDRTIFIVASALWYFINIFDAYVEGTLKTFDISDDLDIIVQPSASTNISQSPGIGLSISLQPKK